MVCISLIFEYPSFSAMSLCSVNDDHFTFSAADGFDGPTSKIWSDDQCNSLGIHYAIGTNRCQTKCSETADCSAVNYEVSTCVLLGCTQPVHPAPSEEKDGWKGYKMVPCE